MIDLIKFIVLCITTIICFGFACEYSCRKYKMKNEIKKKDEEK